MFTQVIFYNFYGSVRASHFLQWIGGRIGTDRWGSPGFGTSAGAPMFYTAWEPLTLVCRNANKMLLLNRAMEERFKTRTWMTPLPQQGRIPHFPQCAFASRDSPWRMRRRTPMRRRLRPQA